MKILVIFDSLYGNTEKIALAIAEGLRHGGEVKVAKVYEVDPQYLNDYNLLIAGSPTQAGRPTQAFNELFGKIPQTSLKGVAVASFDTGIPAQGKGFFKRLLLKVLGYAAPHITKALVAKGGRFIKQPEGFLVEDKEGPLLPGEEDRAKSWGAEIVQIMNNEQANQCLQCS